jgi:hypothetical protein
MPCVNVEFYFQVEKPAEAAAALAAAEAVATTSATAKDNDDEARYISICALPSLWQPST